MTARTLLCATFLGLTLSVTSAAPAGAGGADTKERFEAIQLLIRNTGQQSLRCVALLAHFVTRDLRAIAPNETVEVELLRNLATGELAYGALANKPMMLENLLCGPADDWASSYRDAPILIIRSAPGRQFALSCGQDRPFRCVLDLPD